jgi:hypothetical protein
MRRRIAIVLLALGTVGGYASGFASLHQCHARRSAWERHVAQVCIDAAQAGQHRSAASARPGASSDVDDEGSD